MASETEPIQHDVTPSDWAGGALGGHQCRRGLDGRCDGERRALGAAGRPISQRGLREPTAGLTATHDCCEADACRRPPVVMG